MKRLELLLAACLVASCGPAGDGADQGGRLDFGVFAAALTDRVASLQVSLLSNGKSYDCTQVQRDCLSSLLGGNTSKLVKLTDANGKERPALVFPLDGGTQTLTVTGIPVGQDFAVVIEALTKDNPPGLYGSSCNYRPEIVSGSNPPMVAATISSFPSIDGGVKACDPRFEK